MTSRPSLAAVGIAAAVLLSVAACSSSSATSAPATTAPTAAPSTAPGSEPPVSLPSALASVLGPGGSVPDAKTLLTADMAASVIGGTPTQVAPPMSIPNMSIASYTNDNGDTVTIFVEAIPGGVLNAELQAAIAMSGAQGDFQPVSGLGDAAGKTVGDQDATVGFVKGGTLVAVEATSGTIAGSDLEPKLEAIARQLASGL